MLFTRIDPSESYRAEESDMQSGLLRFTRVAAGLIASLGLTPIFVDAAESTAAVTITVFDDRYVESEQVYDDLNTLDRHVALMNLRSVIILICGADASRSVKAAVHRFRTVPVQLRVPDVDEEVCLSQASLATPARKGSGSRPAGIDDIAVNEYWKELMP
jgi:hypothetical protein